MQLLEIGLDTQQLSACRLSLMLGVHQPEDNRIQEILSFACKVLNVQRAVWHFEHEPYVWHYQDSHFSAIEILDAESLQPDVISLGNYSNYLMQLGCAHERYLNLVIEFKNQYMGQIYLFDETQHVFSEDALLLVKNYLRGAVEMIQLKEQNSALKELYEQQASLSHSKTKYFQILSHDLRAPFHGLLGFTDVLLYEKDTLNEEEQHQIIEYLNHTAKSMYTLLESVLAWAMADGGRFVYNPINFAVTEIVKIVFDVLGGVANKKQIRLVNDVDASIQIHADMNMMTSVIQNLVSNALKFTHLNQNGCVRIWSQNQGDRVHIYVQDTGMGMSKTQLEQLFQPVLTMRHKGTDGESGAGLGLVLCKRFIDLNLGEILVQSEEMKGTTFEIILPAASKVQTQKTDNLIVFKQIGHS